MEFPEILCGNILNFGHMFVSIKFSDSDSNWIFTPIICILVVIEFLLIQTFYKLRKNKVIKFQNILESDRLGCWVVILVPIFVYYYKEYSDFIILIIGSISGLAVHCLFNDIYIESGISISLCIFIMYTMSGYVNILSIFNPIMLSVILSKVLPSFYMNLFTIGECIMLSQLISLFMLKSLYFSIFTIYYLTLGRLTTVDNGFKTSSIITTVFIFIFYFICQYFSKNIYDDICYLILPLICVKNIILFLNWLALLFICVSFVYLVKRNVNKLMEHENYLSKLEKEKILHLRKVFHFGASLVFITGLIYDAKPLLLFCSTALLVAMLLLEHVRQKQIGIIGKQLQAILSPFFDKRDKGIIVLSPISLLCGLAMPIWLSNFYESDGSEYENFWLWSGIITVGIGDSFAALVGRKCGRTYWNKRTKGRTVEGSLACFISQLLACFALFQWFQIPFLSLFAQRIVIAVLVTTFIEAYTDQLDNFILPLVFCSFR